jgi:cyclopropane-fatty-acyl-phospholipid synthase
MIPSGLARRLVFGRLDRLTQGSLTLVDRHGTHRFGGATDPGPTVTVRDDAFFRTVALRGHVGAADSYVAGEWDADDLTGVVQVLLRNRDVMESLETGLARLVQPARTLLHALRRNTRSGSRKNVSAHYDLGNEFFECFLDETMTYSCGIFPRPESTLKEASIEKYDRICRKLDFRPGDRVVEIGSGWGGFAIHAASEYGAHVTTTTLSGKQHERASERVREAGLEDRVRVLRADYRDLSGRYDKLVSIEMIEAVGHRYHETYFRRCASLVGPDGLAAIQSITLPDRYYESARREVDFIKRHIFPGGCIPSVPVLSRAAARAGLGLVDLEDISPHYGETIRRWRARFEEHWPAVRALGHSEEFRRTWMFYFAYCEGGFNEEVLGDVQLVFAGPGALEARVGPRSYKEGRAV